MKTPDPLDYDSQKTDPIEREPPNWKVLPVMIVVVIVIFFITIPLVIRTLR